MGFYGKKKLTYQAFLTFVDELTLRLYRD